MQLMNDPEEARVVTVKVTTEEMYAAAGNLARAYLKAKPGAHMEIDEGFPAKVVLSPLSGGYEISFVLSD